MKDSEAVFLSIQQAMLANLVVSWKEFMILRDALMDEGDPMSDTVEWMVVRRCRPRVAKEIPVVPRDMEPDEADPERLTYFVWYFTHTYGRLHQVPRQYFKRLQDFEEEIYTQKRYSSLENAVRSLHGALTRRQ